MRWQSPDLGYSERQSVCDVLQHYPQVSPSKSFVYLHLVNVLCLGPPASVKRREGSSPFGWRCPQTWSGAGKKIRGTYDNSLTFNSYCSDWLRQVWWRNREIERRWDVCFEVFRLSLIKVYLLTSTVNLNHLLSVIISGLCDGVQSQAVEAESHHVPDQEQSQARDKQRAK